MSSFNDYNFDRFSQKYFEQLLEFCWVIFLGQQKSNNSILFVIVKFDCLALLLSVSGIVNYLHCQIVLAFSLTPILLIAQLP